MLEFLKNGGESVDVKIVEFGKAGSNNLPVKIVQRVSPNEVGSDASTDEVRKHVKSGLIHGVGAEGLRRLEDVKKKQGWLTRIGEEAETRIPECEANCERRGNRHRNGQSVKVTSMLITEYSDAHSSQPEQIELHLCDGDWLLTFMIVAYDQKHQHTVEGKDGDQEERKLAEYKTDPSSASTDASGSSGDQGNRKNQGIRAIFSHGRRMTKVTKKRKRTDDMGSSSSAETDASTETIGSATHTGDNKSQKV
ncbi:MAG: hypothetical protein Q9162_007377 [Coniocarpon cinnabarinum]